MSQGDDGFDRETVSRLRHDLRNHLNRVIGYAELLAEDPDESFQGALGPAVEEILGAGREVLAAVDDLLGAERLAVTGFDAAGLLAATRPGLERVSDRAAALAEPLEAMGRNDAVVDAGRIEAAARGAVELVVAGRSTRGAASPVAPAPAGAAGAEGEGEGEAGADGTVLVVDDDPENRDVLARWLKRLGYSVLQAVDGAEALEVLRAQPVDLMLLDLRMPGLDGFGVLEARHHDPVLRDVPTVMISGSGELDSVVRCIEMGAEDYLPKPFDPVLLRARVGACLEKKRLRDQERALLATVSDQATQLAEWNATLEARVAAQVEELDRLTRLRRFLSPQLADLIVGDERVLESHRRDIAVLFCDLRGFTAFAEAAEPEDVMGVLREYHYGLGTLVHRFEATVGFFAGDGLMVFFNDPLPCPDAPDRALRLAVAMREHMAALTDEWVRRGFELGFGVGVASGYATLGEIG
ncbi:MAG TPA: response regulator, partial [Acidimicrobiia bacterium]|nr:response regulator [Acidimicrobiia bacterium]